MAVRLRGRLRLNSYNPSYVFLEGTASKKKYYSTLPFFFSTKNIESFASNMNFVKAGYEIGQGQSALFRAVAAYGQQFKVNTAKFALEYEYNTLGERTFPVSGRKTHISLCGMKMTDTRSHNGSVAAEQVWRAKLDMLWNNYYPLHRNFNLGVLAQGGISVGKRFSDIKTDFMTSHEFMPLESMDYCYLPGLRSDDFMAVGAIPVWNLFQRIQLRGEAFAYSKFRESSAWKTPFSKTEFLGRVSLVTSLPFASVSMSVSYCSALHGWNYGVAIGWFVPHPKL